jgi:hypothetical protein
LGGLLLCTWFGWSLAVYGPNGTFKSNTSVTSAQKYPGSNFAKICANLFDTLVPTQIRYFALLYPSAGEPNLAGFVRDNAFAFYQVNIIFGMGLVGGPFVLWLLYRSYRSGNTGARRERGFWFAMIPFCFVVGVAVFGERDRFGSAHLTLLPLEVLGLSLIAAWFPWRRKVAMWILAGCVIDFGLGVLLQAHVEGLENTPTRTVFTAAVKPWDGTWQRGSSQPASLSVAAWENWFAKHSFALSRRMLANLEGFHPSAAQSQQDANRVRAKMESDLAEDDTIWHGWWARHDYELRFLGDDVADSFGAGAAPSEFILVAGFAALMAAMVRGMVAKPRRLAPVVRVAKARRSHR